MHYQSFKTETQINLPNLFKITGIWYTQYTDTHRFFYSFIFHQQEKTGKRLLPLDIYLLCIPITTTNIMKTAWAISSPILFKAKQSTFSIIIYSEAERKVHYGSTLHTYYKVYQEKVDNNNNKRTNKLTTSIRELTNWRLNFLSYVWIKCFNTHCVYIMYKRDQE